MNSIVFISKSHVVNNIGGAEVQADILAKSLAEIGWDVVFVTNAVSKRQYFSNYELIPAPIKKKCFKNLLRELDADIYYQRGRKELTGWVGEFCEETQKKFVFSVSMDIDCTGHKYLYRDADTLINFIKHSLYFFQNKRIDEHSLQGMKQASIIIAQTNNQKKALTENLGLGSKVFYNVHEMPKGNGYSKDRNNLPIILWLANIKEWKQPELFLNLARDMKNVKCKFLLAGKIKSKKYKKLIKYTEEVNSNFEYIGPVPFEVSNSLIESAYIFVNTSNSQEGFPNTFIQAWLRGTPTVSLNFDPDGLIKKKKLGIIAENCYVKLKESISELLINKSLRDQFSANALKFSSQNFEIKNNIKNFIKLLQN